MPEVVVPDRVVEADVVLVMGVLVTARGGSRGRPVLAVSFGGD